MEILLLIFGLIAILEFIFTFAMDWDNDCIPLIMIGSASTLVIVSCVCYIFLFSQEEEIKAIEVYRNNTTLQITYQDSTPIDSVVVYKNK